MEINILFQKTQKRFHIASLKLKPLALRFFSVFLQPRNKTFGYFNFYGRKPNYKLKR
jgi:hypothetical protein